MLARFGSLLLALIVVSGPPLRAQEAERVAPRLSDEETAAVDAAVESEIERQRLVGVAVGVIRQGRVAYLKGYGLADREGDVPVTEATLFRWASAGKPLTAIAALQLAQEGKLDLDADVRQYVPEFPDKGVKITSRQLLGHLGGIVHYANGRVIRTAREYPTAHPFEDVVLALDTFKESPLVCQPGEKYAYSTHGYILLSAVVQRAGGEKFADQVRDRIIRPLDLATLQPDYQWVSIPNRAVGYRLRDGEVVRSTDTDVSWKLGGGGYLSDIGDFARFAEALIDRRLVDEATETMMWTPQKTNDGQPTDYGLGFGVETDERGRLKISHNGAQEKSRTRLVIYPRERHGVVVMSNSENAEPARISTAVYAALSRARRPAAPATR